jgi:hypothetical protein
VTDGGRLPKCNGRRTIRRKIIPSVRQLVRESGRSEAAPLVRTGHIFPPTRTNWRALRTDRHLGPLAENERRRIAPQLRIHGLSTGFEKTGEARLVALKTAHDPITRAPHVTSNPIKSSLDQ